MIRMFHDVEVEGRRTDVLVRGQHIAALAADLDSTSVDDVVDGRGGALLPGLHDHHVHLFAMAAALTSVQCGPPAVGDLDALAHALRTAPLDHDWIRGVGYHESVAGPLDRHL